MYAVISAIEYYLPDDVLTNADLAKKFPEWSIEKIYEKTGIQQRHIAADKQCASDLGYMAAKKLFENGSCSPQEVEFLIVCTQSPDYFLPTTACILQDRLNIPTGAGALDFNLGCSGFVYGLGLAKGLIESGQVKNVLFITAETYSKYIDSNDKTVRTIFGDGAAATFLQKKDIGSFPGIHSLVFGTDGRGGRNLIVSEGGGRNKSTFTNASPKLFMDGSEIYSFTLKAVPKLVKDTLKKASLSINDIDMYIFHQANRYMLDHLKRKIDIPDHKFYVSLENVGNTVSSTIPIALKNAIDEHRINKGDKIMLVGFGVGYSWCASIVSII